MEEMGIPMQKHHHEVAPQPARVGLWPRHPDRSGRHDSEIQVLHADGGLGLWQERDLHAKTGGRG